MGEVYRGASNHLNVLLIRRPPIYRLSCEGNIQSLTASLTKGLHNVDVSKKAFQIVSSLSSRTDLLLSPSHSMAISFPRESCLPQLLY